MNETSCSSQIISNFTVIEGIVPLLYAHDSRRFIVGLLLCILSVRINYTLTQLLEEEYHLIFAVLNILSLEKRDSTVKTLG